MNVPLVKGWEYQEGRLFAPDYLGTWNNLQIHRTCYQAILVSEGGWLFGIKCQLVIHKTYDQGGFGCNPSCHLFRCCVSWVWDNVVQFRSVLIRRATLKSISALTVNVFYTDVYFRYRTTLSTLEQTSSRKAIIKGVPAEGSNFSLRCCVPRCGTTLFWSVLFERAMTLCSSCSHPV